MLKTNGKEPKCYYWKPTDCNTYLFLCLYIDVVKHTELSLIGNVLYK